MVGSQGPELTTKPLRQQAEIVLRKQEAATKEPFALTCLRPTVPMHLRYGSANCC
jgi:hypothetical protein